MIGQQIDQAANNEAELIKAGYAYGPGQSSSSATRDSYCAIHHNDA